MGFSERHLSGSLVRVPRPGFWAVLLAASLVALLFLASWGYRAVYRDRIYPGIRVNGVPVGGMSTSQASAALAVALSEPMARPLSVEVDGRTWSFSRSALGARYDVPGLVEQAFGLGRSGGPLDQSTTLATLLIRPRDLDATVRVDTVDWSAILDPIAHAIERPPVDARLAVEADGSVQVVPDRAGVVLNREDARKAIEAALASGSTETVTLTTAPVLPAIHAADLAEARRQAAIALSGPISVRYDGHTWTLDKERIRSALVLPRPDGSGSLTRLDLEPSALDGFLAEIAATIDRPAEDARLVLQDGEVSIAPSRSARAMDRQATLTRIRAALTSEDRSVVPVVHESPPVVVEANLSSALAIGNQLIKAPIVLNGPNSQNWTLDVSTLRSMLLLSGSSLASTERIPHLDPAKLASYVASLARDIDRPPSNARFRRNGGQVALIRDGVTGYQLDQAALAEMIQQAAASDDRTVTLPVASVPPAFGAGDASALSGLQLVAQNSTSYAGSIPPRRHNVELANSMLNGVVVAPGQVFSFNRELGPQTLDRGFQVGYGIVAQANGGVKTVPSVGGGICQVSTTLFQPIFWAGYEIEERHWHAYWIAHYASHGYPGLDDTVDDSSGLDFQFKNTTANPLLIQSSTDGDRVYFSIYGVAPTWTVHVDPPVVTNVVKTDRQLRIEPDPNLPPGEKIYTEAAEDGFTVTVHRTVDEGGGSIRNLTLRSVYAPSHNVIAVGPSV